MTQLCICQSGKLHVKCCAPLLTGQRFAKTAVQLMRSRYSAFALGGYGEYLLNTWSPSQHQAMTAAELSIISTKWIGLEIVSKAQKGDQATVEFKAYFLDGKGEQGLHHERSRFERLNGRWLYLTGEVF